MSKNKRLISIIILISTILTIFNFSGIYSFANQDLTKYQGNVRGGNGYPTYSELISIYGLEYDEWKDIPNVGTFYFNIEIYIDKQLVVYTPIDNNFRTYNPRSTGSRVDFKEVSSGYFSENSKRGEYRYLGYDPNGNIMSSRFFPPDFSDTPPLNESNWVQLPWGSTLSSSVKSALGIDSNYGSFYESISTLPNQAKQVLRESIGEFTNSNGSVSFALGTRMANAETYAMIQNVPSLLLAGSVKMVHQFQGSYRYQVFNGVLTKKASPGLTSIIKTDQTTYTIPIDKETVDVLVTVDGHLHDELYLNDPIYKLVYYNRNDLNNYNFDLKNSTNKHNRSDLTNEKTNKPSKGFLISFKREDLQEGTNNITFNSNLTASFLGLNNEKLVSPANTSITINVVPKTDDAYVKLELTAEPSNIEFQGTDVEVKVRVKAELLNYNNADNIQAWIFHVKKDLPGTYTMKSVASSKLAEEVEYTFIIPKTELASVSTFEQFFVGYATVYFKTGLGEPIRSNDDRCSTKVWKTPPIPPRPLNGPIVNILGPRQVEAGALINFLGRATPQEPEATIESYSWYSDPTRVSGNTQDILTIFPNVAEYILFLDATDSNSLTGTGMHSVSVVEPYPIPIIKYSGTLKENRKITIDGSTSFGNAMYGINWPKSYWMVEGVEGSSLEGIFFDVPLSNMEYLGGELKINAMQKFNMQVPAAGKYKFTLYVENTTFGNSNTTVATYEVLPDQAPVVNFSTLNIVLREPDNYRRATLKITDLSHSMDNDLIGKRTINIYYNSSNGNIDGYENNPEGVMHGASWELIKTIEESNASIKDFSYEVHEVGKYKVEIAADEVPGNPTLDTGTYRSLVGGILINRSYTANTPIKTGDTGLKNINEKVIDVRNIAPSTMILANKKDSMKIVDVVFNALGSFFDISKIKERISSFLIPSFEADDVDYNVTVLEDSRISSTPGIFVGPTSVFINDYKNNVYVLGNSLGKHNGVIMPSSTKNTEYSNVAITNLKDLKLIADGTNHTALVLDDNRIRLWGTNTSGQLGDGTVVNKSYAASVYLNGLGDIVQIDVGANNTAILNSAGEVYTMGTNGNGQIGDGTTINRLTPYRVQNIPVIKKIAVADNYMLALTTDGEVYGWGLNTSGQLGDGTLITKSSPVKINGLSNIVDISVGSTHSLAVNSNGEAFSWGTNSDGRLGIGTNTSTRNTPQMITTLNNVVSVAATTVGSRFLTSNSEVYYAGDVSYEYDEDYGSTRVREWVPKLIDSDVIIVKARGYNGVHLKNSGDAIMYYRYYYSSSYGSTERFLMSGGTFKGINNLIDIVAYTDSVFAIDDSNSLFAWGYENSGQNVLGLGRNNADYRTRLVGQVKKPYELTEGYKDTNIYLEDIIDMSINNQRYIYVVNSAGQVFTWGRGDEPKLINGIPKIKKIYTYTTKGFAVDLDGDVYKFNASATTINDITFTKIEGLVNPISIVAIPNNLVVSAAYYVIDNNGTLRGRNFDNDAVDNEILSNVASFAWNGYTMVASTTGGQVYTWGLNRNGCLGVGDNNTGRNQATPILVPSLSNVKAVYTNPDTTDMFFALTNDGKVFGWGNRNTIMPGTESMITAPKDLGSQFSNIKKIVISNNYIVGLRNDGSIMGTFRENDSQNYAYMHGVNSYGTNMSSYFSFRMLPPQEPNKLSKVLENIEWRDDSTRYLIDYNNNLSYLNGKEYTNTVSQLLKNSIIFVSINKLTNKDTAESVISRNYSNGKYISSNDIDLAFNKISGFTTKRKPVDLYINIGDSQHDNVKLVEKRAAEIIKPILESYNIEPSITVSDGERIKENRLYYKGTDNFLYEFDPISNIITRISSIAIGTSFVAADGYVYYSTGTGSNIDLRRYDAHNKTTEIVLNKFFENVYMGEMYGTPMYAQATLSSNFVVHNNKVHATRIYSYWNSNYAQYVTIDLDSKQVDIVISTSYGNNPSDGTVYSYNNFIVSNTGKVLYSIYRIGSGAPTMGGHGLPLTVQYWFNGHPSYTQSNFSENVYYMGAYVISGFNRIGRNKPGAFLNAGSTNGSGVFSYNDKVYFSTNTYSFMNQTGGFYEFDERTEKMKHIKTGDNNVLRAMTPDAKIWYTSGGKTYVYDISTKEHTETTNLNINQAALYHPDVPTRRIRKRGIEETMEGNNWRKNSFGFYAYMHDMPITELSNSAITERLQDKLREANINFVGLGRAGNKAQVEEFISKLDFSSFIDNSNLDAALTELAMFIVENAGLSKNSIDLYLLVGQEVEFYPTYDDKEIDPMNQDRWRITHDSSYFENDLGVFEYDNQYILEPPLFFDKTGRYEVFYQAQDNPKSDFRFDNYKLWSSDGLSKINVYVHRRPIANFSYDLALNADGTRYDITFTDKSYDLDHLSKPDKGIVAAEWVWKEVSGLEWKKGKPAYLLPDMRYIIQLGVKDREGQWSFPYIEEINTNSAEMKPIVLANPDSSLTWLNRLTAQAQGDLTVAVEAKAFVGKTISEVQFAWSTSMAEPTTWTSRTQSNFPLTQTQNGVWYLHLNARDSEGLWSNPYVSGPYLIDKIDPSIDANPQTYKGMGLLNVIITATDTGGSGLSSIRYNWTQSATKPSTGWVTLAQSTATTAQEQDGIWYLHMEATDNAGNSFYRNRSYEIDGLKVSATLMPNPAMAGDQLIFNITTEGYAERLEIFVDSDIIAKDKRVEMGYQAQTYPLSMNVNGAVNVKTSIMKYVVWVTTDLTLDKNNNRLRPTYKFTVRAWRGTNYKDVELELDIKGDIRSLIRPGIKNKN